MPNNILPLAEVDQLIAKYSAEMRAHADRRDPLPTGPRRVADIGNLERYVDAAVRNIVASVESAERVTRGLTLLKGAIALHSLIQSPWVPEHLRSYIDPQALLLPAAVLNGYNADTSEAHARRTISNALKYAQPRPEPAEGAGGSSADEGVPTRVYAHPYTPVGTQHAPETPGTPTPALDEAERAEIAELLPLPRDGDGRSIKPDMIELAMLRRDNPRRGATHLLISQAWQNPCNATYHRRVLFRVLREAFGAHLAGGGSIYQVCLRVGTASADDVEICKAELREWDRLRKRLQRAGALWRWFSTQTTEGVFRVIFASAPLFDGQAPLEDPEAALLEVMRQVTSLGAPYKRRHAHGGPDDEWAPKHTENGEWATVGHRPGSALLEMGQDPHDKAAAAANGVRTWLGSDAEVNGRTPEVILRTRHWAAPAPRPEKILFDLFEEVGFEMSQKAWDRAFGDQAVPVGDDGWGPERD